MAKIYRVPVYYQLCEYVCVKAESAQDAIDYVNTHSDDLPIHQAGAYYVDDSYEVENDDSVVNGYPEKNDDGTMSWHHPNEVFSETYYDATTSASS